MADEQLIASLHEEVTGLRQSVAELSLLNDIASEIASSLNTRAIIESIIDGALRAVNAEEGVISLFDSKSQSQTTHTRVTLGEAKRSDLRLNPVVQGWVGINKLPLLLNSPREDKRFSMIKWDDRIRSILLIPLLSKSELAGVLTVFNKQDSAGFTEGDQRLLTIIASQSAQVLTNAKLFERERKMLHKLQQLRVELLESNLDIIHTLVRAAEYRDTDTGDHIVRISRYCAAIAEKLGLPLEQIELILYAAPMHDIGKIGIPDHILLKKGRLTDEEFKLMQSHTTIGAKILANSKGDIINTALDIALTHHERWDGSGYPRGLKGEEIPLMGRIVALADVFDALCSRRPYKEPYPFEESCKIIVEGGGKHFDPIVVDAFMGSLDTIQRIQEEVAGGKGMSMTHIFVLGKYGLV